MMQRFTLHSLLSLTLLSSYTLALNDWTVPCTSGRCSYDAAYGNTGRGGIAVNIWSTNQSAISDITPAAGWLVLGCNQTTSQDVRIMCKGNEQDPNGCGHLFQNGAQDTIVRLPQNCGMPFGRVASAAMAADQSIPKWASDERASAGKNTTKPAVHSLRLDTSWTSINNNTHGPVYFSVNSSAVHDAGPALAERGLIDKFKHVVHNVESDVKSEFQKATSAVVSEVEKATSAVGAAVSAATAAVGEGIDIAKGVVNALTHPNHTIAIPPVNINQHFNIIDISTPCNSIGDLDFHVDVDASVSAELTVEFDIAGDLTLNVIHDFIIQGGLSADFNSALHIKASGSSANLDSGDIQIASIPITPIDVPGIFALGPIFTLTASASGTLDVNADFTLNLAYHVDNATATFPPGRGPSGAQPQPHDTPLQLSVSADVETVATLSAHLTPKIDLGLTLFSNKVNAGVFILFDAAANLELDLSVHAEAGNTTLADGADSTTGAEGTNSTTDGTLGADGSTNSTDGTLGTDGSTNSTDATLGADGSLNSTDATLGADGSANSTADATLGADGTTNSTADATLGADGTTSNTTDAVGATIGNTTDAATDLATRSSSDLAEFGRRAASAQVNACITADMALNAQIGVSADFFGHSAGTSVNIWSLTFRLFQKCIGNATPKSKRALASARPSVRSRRVSSSLVKRSRDLRSLLRRGKQGPTCPASDAPALGEPVQAVDETVQAADIKQT